MIAISFLLIGVLGFSQFAMWRYIRQTQADLIHLAVFVREKTGANKD